MKDISKLFLYIIIVIVIFFGFVTAWEIIDIKSDFFKLDNNINNAQFGGSCPVKIYQVYDRDTGVYYAVTEKGGICVMQTLSGETKLVDQGDGATIHLNKN